MCRTASKTKSYVAQNVNSAKVENPCYKGVLGVHQIQAGEIRGFLEGVPCGLKQVRLEKYTGSGVEKNVYGTYKDSEAGERMG